MPPGVKPCWDDNHVRIQEAIIQYHIGREKEEWDAEAEKQNFAH